MLAAAMHRALRCPAPRQAPCSESSRPLSIYSGPGVLLPRACCLRQVLVSQMQGPGRGGMKLAAQTPSPPLPTAGRPGIRTQAPGCVLPNTALGCPQPSEILSSYISIEGAGLGITELKLLKAGRSLRVRGWSPSLCLPHRP